MSRHTFKACIGRIGILRCVTVPPAIVTALGGASRIPVVARYAGDVTRSTLGPAGGMKRRLVLQMRVLRAAGLDTGHSIEVTVERTSESHKSSLPSDLARALQFRPAAAAELERASPSTWRMIAERLEQARTAETRQRRVEHIVERLAEMAGARKARERRTPTSEHSTSKSPPRADPDETHGDGG